MTPWKWWLSPKLDIGIMTLFDSYVPKLLFVISMQWFYIWKEIEFFFLSKADLHFFTYIHMLIMRKFVFSEKRLQRYPQLLTYKDHENLLFSPILHSSTKQPNWSKFCFSWISKFKRQRQTLLLMSWMENGPY